VGNPKTQNPETGIQNPETRNRNPQIKERYVAGQFHRHGVDTLKFGLNFETTLAQTKDKRGLSSFTFMNMFVPTDILIGLYNFSN